MQLNAIILNTKGTTYTFYAREKTIREQRRTLMHTTIDVHLQYFFLRLPTCGFRNITQNLTLTKLKRVTR